MIATRGNFCILSLNTRLLIKAGKRDETKIYSGVIARNLATPSATDLLSWEAKSSKNKAWPKDFMTSTNNQVSKISQQTSTNIFECTTALPLIRQAKFITASYLTDPHLLQLGQFFAVAFCSEKKTSFSLMKGPFFRQLLPTPSCYALSTLGFSASFGYDGGNTQDGWNLRKPF